MRAREQQFSLSCALFPPKHSPFRVLCSRAMSISARRRRTWSICLFEKEQIKVRCLLLFFAFFFFFPSRYRLFFLLLLRMLQERQSREFQQSRFILPCISPSSKRDHVDRRRNRGRTGGMQGGGSGREQREKTDVDVVVVVLVVCFDRRRRRRLLSFTPLAFSRRRACCVVKMSSEEEKSYLAHAVITYASTPASTGDSACDDAVAGESSSLQCRSISENEAPFRLETSNSSEKKK